MKAAALDDDRHAFKRAGDELALVPRGTGLREAGNGGVRNAHGGINLIRQRPEPGAEHDRDAGL